MTIQQQSLLATVAAMGLVAVLTAIPASANAPAITFHLDGTGDLVRQGTFTAPLPLCSSGTWQGNGLGSRVFTCTDGSGTFTATFDGELEDNANARGPWSIVSGTGRYVTLRGKGTATVDAVSGPDESPTYSDTWSGVVDFDATSPKAQFTSAKVTRAHSRTGRWTVRVGFTASDNVQDNLLSFDAVGSSGHFLAHRVGGAPAGPVLLAYSFRKLPSMRIFRVELRLSDPVGNRSRLKISIVLR
jgi:hypothetical protein